MTTEQPHIVYTVNNILADPIEILEFSTLDYPNAKELAVAKLAEIRSEYLFQQANRFHVAKVITNGDGEVWHTASLETDPEEGNYQVLNHLTGLYDPFPTVTAVKSDIEAKKAAFIVSSGLDIPGEIDKTQPKTDLPTA